MDSSNHGMLRHMQGLYMRNLYMYMELWLKAQIQ